MAVWGAPVAHEDDAERAVRAALELIDAVRALGRGIQARAGVLTGEAAVTLGATNQGMVAGDLVNTASRLQSAAPPGAVLVGQSTQRAAAKAVEFEPAGEQTLKGKSAPVPAWRALRVVAERGGRNRAETIEAPFVGRDDDLRLLKDLFHATERDRRTRLVSVVGPGGIGKSRIAWEFLKYIDGLVQTVYWHDGRSPAYGEGITFWALGEMIRSRCRLLETDDEATTRQRVHETVGEWVPDATEATWIESALLTLLGIESGIGREQLFAAWRTFFERLASNGPVVLVFEDLHFADIGLLDFVDHLLEWSKGVPIYVVTLARPDLLERRPDWGAGKRNFVSLALDPLSDAAMRELLAGLVPGLPRPTADAIVARAGGIPLYAVETVRMLLSEGRLREEGGHYVPVGDLSALAVPETLTALIGSRLDALPPDARSLLQDAAVLGQSFTPEALAAVGGIGLESLEPRLLALVRRELLTRELDPRSPEKGQYAFVQALIREVAYNTLSRRDRKVRHLAAARYFETLGSDELAGALAGHYLAAHANAPEGPEADALAGQARIALRAAAERAIELGSQRQAVSFFDQACEVTADPQEEADLRERAGAAAWQGGDSALSEARLRRALELQRQADDPSAIMRVTGHLGSALVSELRREAAVTELSAVVDEFLPAGAPIEDANAVELLAQLSRACMLIDQNDRAIGLADRALAAAEGLDLVPQIANLLITRGTALSHLGRAYEGAGAIRAGIALAAEQRLVTTETRGQLNLGVLLADFDPRESAAVARAALATSERLGHRSFMRTLYGNATTGYVETGEWDRIMGELTAAIEDDPDEFGRNYLTWASLTIRLYRGEEVRDVVAAMRAWALGLGEDQSINAVAGLDAEVALARRDYATAAAKARQFANGNATNAQRSRITAGQAALLVGDVATARAILDELAASGVRGTFTKLGVRHVRAGVAALDGETRTALAEFRAVLAGYRELGVTWTEALAGLVMVAVLDPTLPEVAAAAETARDTFVRLRARPFLETLDEVLARPRPEAHGSSSAVSATVAVPTR
jgi:tetratricopeptide (TPR) repeat protein